MDALAEHVDDPGFRKQVSAVMMVPIPSTVTPPPSASSAKGGVCVEGRKFVAPGRECEQAGRLAVTSRQGGQALVLPIPCFSLVGATPNRARKDFEKCDTDSNPQAEAISIRVRSVVAKRLRPRSSRSAR